MINLRDTTFREGKQSYLGHLLSGGLENFSLILKNMGINSLEISYPFSSKNFYDEAQKLIRSKIIRASVHCPLDINFINKVLILGPIDINVSLKKSNFSSNNNVQKIVREINKLIDNLKDSNYNGFLRITIENAFDLSEIRIIDFINKLNNFKICIGLSDSAGNAEPAKILQTIKFLNSKLKLCIPIGLHFHNDSGLAATNFYNTFSFANEIKREIIYDASLFGLGERCGILSYGDVFSIMKLLKKKQFIKKYNTRFYASLIKSLGEEIDFNRDPLNERSFIHISGVHHSSPENYIQLRPKEFGFKESYLYNETINSENILEIIREHLEKNCSAEKAREICRNLRNYIADNKTCFTHQEVIDFIKKNLNK